MAKQRPRVASIHIPAAGQPAVEVVHLPATPLVTIGPESPCWEDPENALEYHRDAEKALVRIRPPVVSDAVLESVVGQVRSVAAAVRVEARRRPEVVPAEVMRAPAPVGARAVVAELVAEAHVDDREALRELCGAVMDAVKL